jgi:hypothetical protein
VAKNWRAGSFVAGAIVVQQPGAFKSERTHLTIDDILHTTSSSGFCGGALDFVSIGYYEPPRGLCVPNKKAR